MNFSKLNMSIRWKMLGGFVLSALIPSILAYTELSKVAILIISLFIAIGLALFSIFRIMNTIKHVQEHFEPLAGQGTGEEEFDELRLIDESLSHFEEYLEQNRKEDLAGTHSEVKQSAVLEQVYKANLQTGAPICAEVWELPNRRTTELVSSARLAGAEAKIVLTRAKEAIVADLETLKDFSGLDDSNRGILDFQIMILEDPSFMMEVDKLIGRGENLLSVLSRVFGKFTDQMASQEDTYMRERSADFHDLKQRLFEAIHDVSGSEAENRFAAGKGKIAICQHVLPSEVISLCNAGVAGIISLENTPSSHAQILLSSLNVSSLSSINNLPLGSLHGHTVLLDTMKGRLTIEPLPREIKKVMDEYASRKSDVITEKIVLSNGDEFNVGVTVNNPQIEVTHAVDSQPDFVGLFRTEMHFLGQKELPTEDELIHTYQNLIDSFPDKLVVVRMLDLGGDKISGFEPTSGSEENPCMGLRSMRLLLEYPQLFKLQLRAILKASHKQVCLLYPMVSGWSELRKISDFVDETVKELNDEGFAAERPLKGIMVEVPSIVARFEDYVEHFDVFNIGTNDLVQYTLAADRNNNAVSNYYKSTHPSILSMIHKVSTLCKQKDKRAIICGQMGGDLRALPLLLGLGIRNISVNWPVVNELKSLVVEQNIEECEQLAEEALKCLSIEEVERVMKI
ncbi:MAG: phosphoenolpyruvate--protein phosphotransferase [Lentisphaerales bacterium]|nr:phosphoenolpyruvate--protein phosphotransferase [Lentisphaerales bacterium]